MSEVLNPEPNKGPRPAVSGHHKNLLPNLAREQGKQEPDQAEEPPAEE